MRRLKKVAAERTDDSRNEKYQAKNLAGFLVGLPKQHNNGRFQPKKTYKPYNAGVSQDKVEDIVRRPNSRFCVSQLSLPQYVDRKSVSKSEHHGLVVFRNCLSNSLPPIFSPAYGTRIRARVATVFHSELRTHSRNGSSDRFPRGQLTTAPRNGAKMYVKYQTHDEQGGNCRNHS